MVSDWLTKAYAPQVWPSKWNLCSSCLRRRPQGHDADMWLQGGAGDAARRPQLL